MKMDKSAMRKIVEDRIRLTSEKPFQKLVWRILQTKYPSLQTPKQIQDYGSDGHDFASKQFFACYAPENGKYLPKETEKKIESDYKKFEKVWIKNKNFDKWIFVTSNDLTGLPHTKIDELNSKSDGILKENWGLEQLLNICLEMSEDKLFEIFDIPKTTEIEVVQSGVANTQIANNSGTQIVNISSLDESNVRGIVMELIQNQMPVVLADAKLVYEQRISTFQMELLKVISSFNKEELAKFADPDVQFALITTLQQVGRQPDTKLQELLQLLLVQRIKNNESNEQLKNIVFNEALSAINKLNKRQVDILTLVFLLRYTKRENFVAVEQIVQYIDEVLFTFTTDNLSGLDASHLIYAGCGYLIPFTAKLNVANKIKESYPFPFLKEVSQSEVDNLNLSEPQLKIFRKSGESFIFRIVEKAVLKELQVELELDNDKLKALENLFDSKVKSEQEIRQILLEKTKHFDSIDSLLTTSDFSVFHLTTVGKAIAMSHFENQTGVKLNVDIWLK